MLAAYRGCIFVIVACALATRVAAASVSPSPSPSSSPITSASAGVLDQETSDVDDTSRIIAWSAQAFYTGASYGPGDLRLTQIVPRADILQVGSSLLRITLPRYAWLYGVTSGFGDMQLTYLFGLPPAPNGRSGIGFNAVLPTGSNSILSGNTWTLGPSAAVVRFNAAAGYGTGFYFQSAFSFAGPANEHTSVALLQPFIVKRLGGGWSLRSADAMWTYDFVRRTTFIPVSLGIGKLFAFGPESLNVTLSDTVTVIHANGPKLPKNTLKMLLRLMYVGKAPPLGI
jgi:hypothetical protein